MRQQDDKFGPFGAGFFDVLTDHLLVDAERPVRDHVARVGDRGVRERLADDGNLHAAALEPCGGFEDRLLPFGIGDVTGKERKLEHVLEFLHTILAVGEFPVRGHRVEAHGVLDLDHVLALGFERRQRALPGVATVQEQRVVRTFGAHRLDQGHHPVDTADAAVFLGERSEIVARQRIGLGRTRLDPVVSEEILTRDMRRQALDLADPDVNRGFAEIDRRQLRVHVGEMQQRHLAHRLEVENARLVDLLLRHNAAEGHGGTGNGGRGGGKMKEFATGYHGADL